MGFKEYLAERFFISEKDLSFFNILEKDSKAFLVAEEKGDCGGSPHRNGLLVGRLEKNGWKPTTRGVQYMFLHLNPRKNVVSLSRKEFISFIRKGIHNPEKKEALERGYVVVYLEGYPAGVGFFDGEVILNKIPKKAYRQIL